MKRMGTLAAALSALSLLGGAVLASDYSELPLDRATTVGGYEVACTGVGQTKHDPQWLAFPVRIEFSDAKSNYLGGGKITVSSHGKALLHLSCDAPWILLKLPAGEYVVEGVPIDTPAKPRSATFHPPAKGQMRLVLQFPDA